MSTENVEMAAPGTGPRFTLGADDTDADQTGRINPQPSLGSVEPAHHQAASASAIAPSLSKGTIPTALIKMPSKQRASQQEAEMESGRRDYDAYMHKLHALWKDNVDLTIAYRNLAYDIPVPVTDPGVPNLAKSLLNFLTLKFLRTPTKSFLALQPTSGIQRPGQMTLVLAPPGHGKSALLKSLAGRYHSDSRLKGEVLYNGMSYKQARAAGLHVEKLTAFVDQGDIHLALLTVRETFQFALDNSVSDPALLQNEEFARMHAQKVDYMLDLLGLREAEHTILGNAVLRGVSGGQRRRVTIGEMMITNARALFLDEITTGLDSATSFDILNALKSWTRVMHGSTMIALLQPTPECFQLFDNLILLRQGAVVYDGPISDVAQYMHDIGVPVPDDQDLADYLSDFLTDPRMVYYRTIYRAARKAHRVPAQVSATITGPSSEEKEDVQAIHPPLYADVQPPLYEDTRATVVESPTRAEAAIGLSGSTMGAETANDSLQLASTRSAPLTTATLQSTFLQSTYYQQISAALQKEATTPPPPTTQLSPYTHAQFGQRFARTYKQLLLANVDRSAKFMKRNAGFWGPRLFQAVFIGFILGGLFFDLPPEQFQARLGLALFASVNMAFTNAAEIPFAAEGKSVVFKQQDAGFFSAGQYVWSVIICNLPLSIVESVIFSIIIYFLTHFTYDAGRFFFFLLVVWMTNVALSVVFRCITYGTRSQDIANQMSGPVVAIFFLFAGYLVLENNIPRWLIWAFWISPFSWVLRALADNEFYAGRYSEPYTEQPYINYRTGEAYERLFDIDPTWAFKWAAIGYLIGFFLFVTGLCVLVLSVVRFPLTMGTKRFLDEEATAEREEEEAATRQKREVGNSGAGGSIAITLDKAVSAAQSYASSFKLQSASTALPFQPIDLAWRNIHYTVMVDRTDGGKGKVGRKLLTGINGYAKAGQLTALMGSSGAGKTTLMDVIAGRKTAGTIEGEILVNGHPKVTATFNRMCGYVEQQDIHIGTQTVREALHFSALLRLPREVTAAQRESFVNEVLDILELTPIADRVIGDVEMPGLSPGQLKRVTIGVELVSNPPVLFLDEPTSGLDSRAALIVMRVVKRISLTGRSVLCTIHQPSAELFYMFDRLLLLKTGGKEVFFGDIGTDGQLLVDYFEHAPTKTGVPIARKPKATNAASWMLDVIGAGVVGKQQDEALVTDYNAVYESSKLRQNNLNDLAAVCQPKAGQAALQFDHVYASSYATQFYAVTDRIFQYYWRNPSFVWVRQGLMIFLGALLGFLYLQSGVSSSQDVISKMSAIFIGICFPGWTVMTSIIPVMLRNRVVFYREQSSYMYTPYAYAFAISVVEIFYTCLSCIIFLALFYPMVGLINTPTLFFRYFFVQYLVMLVWLSLGQLCASLLPDILVANILSQMFGTFAILFSGIFLTAGEMPKGWKWIYWMNWIPKALDPMTTDQFSASNDGSNGNPFGSATVLTRWLLTKQPDTRAVCTHVLG